ncbi:hypothetical protein F53441_11593 [Fusarium austroafricanum]|uniref:Nephrocystin 3-like N-terminal domain-containing protein n=1 Tax=Fusarium austroafricanum TaxID=2364996 RepID=A0A8H4NLQ8_9HYPO|nr:hypothetical protein F53441_11593 [Fusarium austroafricanum]
MREEQASQQNPQPPNGDGGSEFASTVQGHNVDLGNKSFTRRDNAHTINHNYYAPTSEYEHRGEKRKYEDEQDHDGQTFGYERLLKSLDFPQIDAQHENIRKAHSKTCKWILERPEYHDWLNPSKVQEHHGFFWIKGKPGAGKSTLMKFLLSNARSKMKSKIVIFFFFNARGQDLERSTIGMYRSLLQQLLLKIQRPQSLLDSELLSRISETHEWGTEALRTLFEEVVQSLKSTPLVVFIDALDECNVDEIRYRISSFKSLGDSTVSAGIEYHVCFASRHYPHVTMPRKVDLVLEGHEGHEQDIASYLDSELAIGNSKLADDIRSELQEKASGVFMWVVLVTGILQQKYDQGHIHALKQTLREIPGDLHELFRDILTRDNDNRDELLLCIQWVLFAKHPLKPEELYFVIRSSIEHGRIVEWDRDEIQDEVIRNFILSSSKGLAEITRSSTNPTVQFIHESVRDFLLKDHGLKDILIESSGNLEAESHERLKKSCFEYIQNYEADDKKILVFRTSRREEITTDRGKTDEQFPFFRYAIHNVLYHANAAEEGNIGQTSFLDNFLLPVWIKYNNLFETKAKRRYTLQASLMYILAEHGLGSLIGSNINSQSCFDTENERYGAPVLAAMATGNRKTVWRLMKRETRNEQPTSRLHDLCDEFLEYQTRFRIGRNFTFAQRRGILSYILDFGQGIVASFALASCRPFLELALEDENPLFYAVRFADDYPPLVQLLLDEGVGVECRDTKLKSPLHHVAAKGNEAILILLLSKGASLDCQDIGGRTPLSHAAGNSQGIIVLLLLSQGANLEYADNEGRTPLAYAVRAGSDSTVYFLLAKGANIETVDNMGTTPLFHTTLVFEMFLLKVINVAKILLDLGAIIDKTDHTGQTPLMRAATLFNSQLFDLLVHRGADINKTDNDGCTALLYATRCGVLESARFLILHGASVHMTDSTNGRSVFSYAVERDETWRGVVELLLCRGVLVEQAYTAGITPLSYAAMGAL